ncbi:MAG TPA: sigma-70 family RNA polymerase sigma factor [Burkholderiaceae bacterium]|nr:sigma-70 family RNA polymerase sigma factor [Burkholderiaceae bacterium]
MRDADTAESVMVDTLYEVWQHPDRFRGDSRLSTWVLGIAKYKILSALRSRPVEHEDISDYEERIEDDAPSVLTELEARQRAELIQRCLQSLNDAQRECLHLVFFEELPLAEVARLQSVPEGTVKTRLFHGRRNLRACVERHAAG